MDKTLVITEESVGAVFQKCPVRMVSLKTSQNSQGKNCTAVSSK